MEVEKGDGNKQQHDLCLLPAPTLSALVLTVEVS